VIDAIKEFLQININHDPPTGLHELLRGYYRIMSTPPGPKTVAVFTERRIKQRLQYLQQGLLNQPIRYRRYAQLALASVRFRDHYPSHRTGPVRPPQQLVSYSRPSRDQMTCGLLNIQSIHAGCSTIGFDTLSRLPQVLSPQRRLQQR
jgi:hypothetical protein